MGFIEEMRERGLVAQITHEEELSQHLKEKRTAYVGIDPTAASLHIGHLMPVMTLARWQKAGHRAIALMGGGTALIGDPTGKTSMRQMLQTEDIDQNIANFKSQVRGILDLENRDNGIIVNNADWLTKLEYIPFLREIGSQFSVNRMLTAECFKARMESGLSFLEFNYMLLQGYDFLQLAETENCTIQLGGDDQWSNMLAGMDLIRRKKGCQAYCLTVPLLTTAEGKKMGKTEKGAVWIDPNLTPPFDYFQYWRNVDDAMVGPCLRYFTFLPTDEIKRLESLGGKEINDAKVVLAYEATKIVHGEEEAERCKRDAGKLFESSKSGDGAPEIELDSSKLEIRGDVVEISGLMAAAGICESRSEARRLIKQGGVSVDDQKVADPKAEIDLNRLRAQAGVVLKKGKKHYYRLRISK